MKQAISEKKWLWVLGVCVVLVVTIGLIVNRGHAQESEYDYPVEKTKVVQKLDANSKDAQGVKYILNEKELTAQVGKNYSGLGSSSLSEYEGANDGVCIIPEKVSKNGVEYTVTKIASDAFYMNKKIKVLVVPDTVKELSQYAVGFSNIQYLYIGAGVTSDSSWPYHGCEYLREIKVSPDNKTLKDIDGVLYTADGKDLLMNPACRKGSVRTEYVIPDGVMYIDQYAFSFAKYSKVLLPESMKSIGQYAFDISELTEIDLKNVGGIGLYAFRGCDQLHKVEFPNGNYNLHDNIMDNGGIIRAMFIKKGINSSSSQEFSYLTYLNTLAYEKGATMIGSEAFHDCGQLENVLIPDTVTIIKSYSFSKCPKLKKLYIPPSVTMIGDHVLEGNDTVIYGEKGSTAEEYAKEAGFSFVDVSAHDHKNLMDKVVYEDCYSKVIAKYCSDCGYGADSRQEWKKIDGVIDGTGGSHNFALDKTQQKLILSDTGYDNQGLKYYFTDTGKSSVGEMNDGIGVSDIVIPESVEYKGRDYVVKAISSEAFYGSERVRSIVIPDSVEEINSRSLSSSTLEYLYIGSGVSHISDDALFHCGKLRQIWVSPANPKYYVKNHILYDIKGKVIYDYNKSAKDEPSGAVKTTEQPTSEVPNTEATTAVHPTTESPNTETTTATHPTTESPNPETTTAAYPTTEAPNTGTMTTGQTSTEETTKNNEEIKKTKIKISSCIMGEIMDQVYCGGNTITPEVFIYRLGGEALSCGRDYVVSYQNNMEVGEATCVIEGKGAYTGTLKTYFNITPRKIDGLSTILKGKDGMIYRHAYTGKSIKVKTAFRIPITEKNQTFYLQPKVGRDYKVSYVNNKKPGVATIVYQFNGNYTGTVKKKFLIVPSAPSKCSVRTDKRGCKITWKKSVGASSYVVYRAVRKNGTYKKLIIKKGIKNTSYIDQSCKRGKKYYYRIVARCKKKGYVINSEKSRPQKGRW